jgi:hypothetical protein
VKVAWFLVAVALSPAARPTLSGPELTHDSADGHIKVHFTQVGSDAIANPQDVSPANGVVDLVDDIELGMALVWQEFVDVDGWPAPAPDQGRGGDDRLDVYVTQLSNNGLAWGDPTPLGNSVYFQVNNTAESLGPMTAQSVAGHELHHGLQYAISRREQAPWIAEATSTWVQYRLFHGGPLDLAREVLWSVRLGRSAQRMDATGERFEYAGMTWVEFLLDHARAPRTALKDLWADMADAGGWEEGHRLAVTRLGFTSLEDAVAQYAVWNLFACYRDDGHHYDPLGLPCSFEVDVAMRSANAFPDEADSPTVGRFGATYVELVRDCSTQDATLVVDAPGAYRVEAVRVRAAGGPLVQESVSDGGTTTVTVSGWNDASRLVFVLINVSPSEQVFHTRASVGGTYVAHPAPDGASSLTVQPAGTLGLTVGASSVLHATGRFGSCADGSDVSGTVEWRSSNPSVAAVSAGMVTALAPGHADITALNAEAVSNVVGVDVVEKKGCNACAVHHGAAWGALALLLVSRRKKP